MRPARMGGSGLLRLRVFAKETLPMGLAQSQAKPAASWAVGHSAVRHPSGLSLDGLRAPRGRGGAGTPLHLMQDSLPCLSQLEGGSFTPNVKSSSTLPTAFFNSINVFTC